MRTITGIAIFCGILGAVLLLALSTAVASTRALESEAFVPTSTRPPPFSPTAIPERNVKDKGGQLALQVEFPQDWPWADEPWQSLWTGVQWQDARGRWHDVEGWQGGLDTIAVGVSGDIVGKKGWWVAEADLGKGPFRWLIYRDDKGSLAAISDPFFLPDLSGVTRLVEITLES